MTNYLHKYLANLSESEIGLNFASFACRYKKFTIYCLVGPEENIAQLTFARQKHDQLQQKLKSLDKKVKISTVPQEEFLFNAMFSAYFAGNLTSFPIPADSPLIAAGTDFQQRVWRLISTIPYGGCITYQRLAELAGSPRGARAAGTACGANPLALVIPCHRVVAESGLGGFAGGIVVKKALLALEQAACRTER